MLNLPIMPLWLFQDASGGAAGGTLPDILTSGTAIVVYIFIILSIIACLVVAVLLSGRERKKPTVSEADPLPANGQDGLSATPAAGRFCMLSRIDENRYRYGHRR
ncbi:MAG: hypothetical protein IJA91_07545, partial [Clostridia bacterium]|nr:hypothetical protein [Clostridia bacterium]